jgi:hypothetical protein
MKCLAPAVICIVCAVARGETIQATKDVLTANLQILDKAEAVLVIYREYYAYKSDPSGLKIQKELSGIMQELGDHRDLGHW